MKHVRFLAPLALAVFIGACDDESLNPPMADGGVLFVRYVAVGNSITAGFQSGGINGASQDESYAVLLAGQMGTTFNIPRLNSPGCPPPLINIFTQERLDRQPRELNVFLLGRQHIDKDLKEGRATRVTDGL